MKGRQLFHSFHKKFDKMPQKEYNKTAMEKFKTAIIGGGASGLIVATRLTPQKGNVLFERLDRVGKKLSATGNEQGNISNHKRKRSNARHHAD